MNSHSLGRLRLERSMHHAPPAPLVKVCGLTREEDAALACELGAWGIGFVFAPSPRQVTAERVRRILDGLRSRPALAVGVFAEESAEAIAQVVEEAGLDAVQLHGGERGPRVAEVRQVLSAARGQGIQEGRARAGEESPWLPLVVKVISVPPGGAEDAELRLQIADAADADLLIFDTHVKGLAGGSGVPFAWPSVRESAGERPFLVAGGIGPHNACAALHACGAWGIDVGSGVESSPGKKDERSLRALFAQLTTGGEKGTRF